MKLKLDENVTVATVAVLTEAGHDVHTVADEALTGRPDADVWAACRTEQRMLVTFDLGFADVRSYPPGTHGGVVVLRLADQRPDAVVPVVRELVATHDLDALAGRLVVVTERMVRVRG